MIGLVVTLAIVVFLYFFYSDTLLPATVALFVCGIYFLCSHVLRETYTCQEVTVTEIGGCDLLGFCKIRVSDGSITDDQIQPLVGEPMRSCNVHVGMVWWSLKKPYDYHRILPPKEN